MDTLYSRDPSEYRRDWGKWKSCTTQLEASRRIQCHVCDIPNQDALYSCPNLIVRKHQAKTTLRGICTCWDWKLQKCQGHTNQGKNEELLQTEDAQGDMTADAHVILDWTALLRSVTGIAGKPRMGQLTNVNFHKGCAVYQEMSPLLVGDAY